MVTTTSHAIYGSPNAVAGNGLGLAELVAEGAIPIDNLFLSAAFAFHIIPAARPAVGYCGFNRFVVMAKPAAPAIGDWLAVCVNFGFLTTRAYIGVPAAGPASGAICAHICMALKFAEVCLCLREQPIHKCRGVFGNYSSGMVAADAAIIYKFVVKKHNP